MYGIHTFVLVGGIKQFAESSTRVLQDSHVCARLYTTGLTHSVVIT